MKKRKNNEIQYVKGDPAVEAGMFNDMMGNGSMTEEVEDRYVDLSGMSEYNIKNEIKSSSSQTTPDKDKKSFNFANTIDRKAKILKETDKAYLLLINYKRWNKERTGKDDYSIIAWVSKHPFGKNGKITLKPIQENIKEGYSQKITIGKRKPTITLNSKDGKSINEGIKIKSRGVRASLNEDKIPASVRRLIDIINGKGNECEIKNGKLIVRNRDSRVGNTSFSITKEQERKLKELGYLNENLQENLTPDKEKYYKGGMKIYASRNSIYDLDKLADEIRGDKSLTQEEKDKLCHEVDCYKSSVWSNSYRESLNEDKQETFTSKEANELSKEFRDYLYNLDIPKYYDVRAEKVNDGEYIIRVNIEYGDLVHDHKYLDDIAKQFFNDKDINIMIYEPQELKSEIDEDNIYSSSHIIQKSGNKIYQVKKDDDFLEEEE